MSSCLQQQAVATGRLTVAAAAACVALAQLRRLWWRAKRRAGRLQAPKLADSTEILRCGFAVRKLPPAIDHIIVGSGLSGLYLGALLSKLGRRVLVLEQHYVAGGCTHTFKDKGFEFDTGVHYLGQATELTLMMDFAAGRRGSITMTRAGAQDGSGIYNEIRIGDHVHRYRAGKETCIQDLVAKFPDEEPAIRRFFTQVGLGSWCLGLVMSKQILPAPVWATLIQIPGPAKWLMDRYMHRTLTQVLDDCGLKSQELRGMVSAEFGDYGLAPDEAPFFMHAAILCHYLWEGGFYPVGGSDTFAEALVPPIVDAGGAVLVRAPVTKIVVEKGRAVGVEVLGKHVIKARHSVVSSVGVETTYRQLLDETVVEKMGGPPRSLSMANTKGASHHLYGFIGLDGKSSDLGLPDYNLWSFAQSGSKNGAANGSAHSSAHGSTNGAHNGANNGSTNFNLGAVWSSLFGSKPDVAPSFLESDEAAGKMQLPAFISFPSAKDPEYDSRCPGKSTAVVVTESREEYFGPEPGPNNKRSEHYKVAKERYKTMLLNALLRHFPHLASKVEYVDVGTPLSNKYYLGRSSSYGLPHTKERFLDPTLQIKCRGVRGLYLTGQDFLTAGVFGQPTVAVLTLAKMLGPLSLDLWLLLSDLGIAYLRGVLLSPGPTYPGLFTAFCQWQLALS